MKKSAVFLIGAYLLIYILPLGVRPLFLPDETRYFEIPREMLATGDWIVPRIDGIRYFEKPVLGYWFNAVSMMIFGHNAFAVRFSSAISVGISALAIFLLVRRFSGKYISGILASAIFLTSIMVLAIGTFNVLDSLVSMLITGAIVSFFFAYKADRPRSQKSYLVATGIFCGLAFLTKGFIAFAVPFLTIVPFMIWERRFKELVQTAWLPLLAVIIVALPWSLMIHFREGDFWNYFFWVEHINRFLSPKSGQHAEPLWFFIPGILAGTFPWAVLLPAIIQGLRKVDIRGAFIKYLICWFLFPFLFFSLSSGKLITYVLPCIPPLAALFSIGLVNYFKKSKYTAFNSSVLFIGCFIFLLAIFLIVNATGFAGKILYNSTETWKWILAFISLMVWCIISFYSVYEKKSVKKIAWFCVAPVFFLVAIHAIVPNLTLSRKAPQSFFLRNLKYITPETIVVSDGYLIRSTCLFLKREDIFMFYGYGELGYGLSYADSKMKFFDTKQLSKIIGENNVMGEAVDAQKRSVVLFISAQSFNLIKHQIPKPRYMDREGKFLFVRY